MHPTARREAGRYFKPHNHNHMKELTQQAQQLADAIKAMAEQSQVQDDKKMSEIKRLRELVAKQHEALVSINTLAAFILDRQKDFSFPDEHITNHATLIQQTIKGINP